MLALRVFSLVTTRIRSAAPTASALDSGAVPLSRPIAHSVNGPTRTADVWPAGAVDWGTEEALAMRTVVLGRGGTC